VGCWTLGPAVREDGKDEKVVLQGGVGKDSLVMRCNQKLPALGTGTVHLQAIHRPLPTPHYT